MKIAVIGNSHIGALKRGWDGGVSKEYLGVSLTFFGARNSAISALSVNAGRLIPETSELAQSFAVTSGGQREVNAAEYDVFLAYGMCRELRGQVENHAGSFSSAALTQASLDYWASYNLLKTLDKIKQATERPLFAGHAPLAAAQKAEDLTQDDYHTFLAAAQRLVFDLIPAKLIGQPGATLLDGGATRAEFSKGSERLAVGKPDDNSPHIATEVNHMNAAYGALWLRAFLSRVAQTKKAAPNETAFS